MPPEWTDCTFDPKKHEEAVKGKIAESMRTTGQTPEPLIQKQVEQANVENWSLKCDARNPGNPQSIVGVGNLYPNKGDWYSCTLQKVWVDEDYRGTGMGNAIVNDLLEMARTKENPDFGTPDCQLVTADIDRDNYISRSLFEKKGFNITESFCVPGVNEKADVLRMTLEHSDLEDCKRDDPCGDE